MRLRDKASIIFKPPQPAGRRLGDWMLAPMSMGSSDWRLKNWLAVTMDRIFHDLMESPSFAGMVEQLPTLATIPVYYTPFKEKTDVAGQYDVSKKTIGINYSPEKFDFFRPLRFGFLVTNAHEYRHAFQYLNKEFSAANALKRTKEYCIHHLILEADARAFQATVAWELKESGVSSGYWLSCFLGAPEVSSAFAGAIADDPKSFFDGRAQTAAALAFFNDVETVNKEIKKCLDALQEWMKVEPEKRAEESRAEDDTALHDAFMNWFYEGYFNRQKLLQPPVTDEVRNNGRAEFLSNGAENDEEKTQKPHVMSYMQPDGTLVERSLYMHSSLLPATSIGYYLHGMNSNVKERLEAVDEQLVCYMEEVDERIRRPHRSPGPAGPGTV